MSEEKQEGLRKIRRALLSVSDKTGIVELAQTLRGFDIEIISTGGTSRVLREAGIEVRDISSVTDFPEMMDGRVKTLHPRIHGGLLALRDNEEHLEAMRQYNIEPIDMVVVNLYPFEQTVAREDVTLEEAVEQIDIGGPSMIRSAAKNFRDVAVVVSADEYEVVKDELESNDGSLSAELRRELALLAFEQTSAYDAAISDYLSQLEDEEYATEIPADALLDNDALVLVKSSDLRYGENPHQKAALYRVEAPYRESPPHGIAVSEVLSGKEMSYNNYVDADAAWQLVSDFDVLTCAIIKHTNPAGVGTGASAEEAYRRALETDPVSA
ncbi:MAG TPA: bifunctional phosphoribosylaminoimidazolecarboxamide formyltransferase/IMP cyclohydrolase, partial [Pyrinomonadaceae bacterium]|nr:bifunctional phosphoribosylaminoimidazolecarboxamide formyltransferase/IMP cyclohydrolase [Pyrinomonadaceae bacterium]